MARTHHCGALRLTDKGKQVTLCGWVQEIRDKGHLCWIDLRDRYGITQIILEQGHTPAETLQRIHSLGREYVLQVKGTVIERSAKNPKIPTGEIEIRPDSIDCLNPAKTPPFLITDATDGKEPLRMRYRYLDLRRKPLQQNLLLRHQATQAIRTFLNGKQFIEIETPILTKSTPEGARDFIVPSRLQKGNYYALPQSPQLFKQLLMISGFDRYYQIARCFRDEDLRADRQPEFTQIDCELSFVEQEQIQAIFEQMIRYLFAEIKGEKLPPFPTMDYWEAMEKYGTDRPDLRWEMPFVTLSNLVKSKPNPLFQHLPLIIAIKVTQGATKTRKQLDQLSTFIKENHPTVKGPVYLRYLADGSYKSSVDKYYTTTDFASWSKAAKAVPGDLLLLLGGEVQAVRTALAALRKEVIQQDKIPPNSDYAPLWVVNFPLLGWDEEHGRYVAEHHPFTAPHPADVPLLDTTAPQNVRSQAYDLVINGVEIGGGSIRIHTQALQEKIFNLLGFTKEQAQRQFGFFLDALAYGTPPHGGIALGLDRLCQMLGGGDSIREYIAFPKNNHGRDTMLEAPAPLFKER